MPNDTIPPVDQRCEQCRFATVPGMKCVNPVRSIRSERQGLASFVFENVMTREWCLLWRPR